MSESPSTGQEMSPEHIGEKKSSVDHFGTYRCVRGSCQEGAVWSRHVWRVPFTSWDLVLPRLSQPWRNISQTSWWRFTSREAVVSLLKASSSLARLIVLCRPSSPNRTTRIFSAELPWKSLHHWYLCSIMKVVTFLVGEFILLSDYYLIFFDRKKIESFRIPVVINAHI